jgi:hypothetical protein
MLYTEYQRRRVYVLKAQVAPSRVATFRGGLALVDHLMQISERYMSIARCSIDKCPNAADL